MHTMTTSLSLIPLLLGLATAALTNQPPKLSTNFLLVTTSQLEQTPASSDLANVNATSLFDPFDQQEYLLRLIAPGYNSLPTFNLTSGTLHTITNGILGHGTYEYNSTKVEKGGELQFLPTDEKGNLGVKNEYLLTVDGEEKGWTICDGDLEQLVISWKGTDESCNATYIHAVKTAPY